MRFALILVLCSTALADGNAVTVRVGESATRDVGYARGLHCDDTSVVEATIATDTARDTNIVTFRGLKAGKTQCRAGAMITPPFVLFDIDVSARR